MRARKRRRQEEREKGEKEITALQDEDTLEPESMRSAPTGRCPRCKERRGLFPLFFSQLAIY